MAAVIFLLWGGHLAYALALVDPTPANPWIYLHILIQAYLFTGLFITAHDAMHGNITQSRRINTTIGYLASFLFAGMSYRKLLKNHMKHHRFVATKEDPDYIEGSQGFFRWWGLFMYRYTTILQLLIMAVVFNLLIWIPGINETRALLFWALPAMLGTLQLFFAGVYWPHRLPHTPGMGIHKARTQKKNHFWAMLSCYFFGYHREHHESPRTPWWQLYRTK